MKDVFRTVATVNAVMLSRTPIPTHFARNVQESIPYGKIRNGNGYLMNAQKLDPDYSPYSFSECQFIWQRMILANYLINLI